MWKNRERTDDELIAQHVRVFVADHGQAVDSLLSSIEFDPATREDISSEVFTIVYCRIDQLSGLSHGQTRGWLFRTARRIRPSCHHPSKQQRQHARSSTAST